MTTMQKFKAYFGMVPPSEYEDDYFDEPGPGPVRSASRERAYRDDYYGEAPLRDGYGDSYADPGYRDAVDAGYDERRFGPGFDSAPGYEQGYQGDYTYAGPRHSEPAERARPVSRLEPLQRSSAAPHRSAAVAASASPDLEQVFADGPLHKITTLRPADYSEARTIGERFRDGNPVIMDLVDMSNDDAKRLVDFAAGLAFALRGSFDKVATKVFLLSPADIDVSAEDRKKIAATGFYNHG